MYAGRLDTAVIALSMRRVDNATSSLVIEQNLKFRDRRWDLDRSVVALELSCSYRLILVLKIV
jgi:hypothetical protein